MDPVERFLEEQTLAGSWPGACWTVVERGRTVSSGAVGWRSLVPERCPSGADTIYDLASLTKPLVTASLLALLVQDGRLDLDAPAESLLPGLAFARQGRPTFMDLALHRAGLPAWRPFYLFAKTPDRVLNSVMRLEAEAPCGARVKYSDPDYILLGEAVRRAAGQPLDELFHERIAKPLGLSTLVFNPPAAWRGRIAPTEVGNRYEEILAESLGFTDESPEQTIHESPAATLDRGEKFDIPNGGSGPSGSGRSPDRRSHPRLALRTTLIHGEVHDGNAHALGGVAGHAGLFGDVTDTAKLAKEFLGAGRGLFEERTLRLFRENRTPGLEQGRTVGWKRTIAGTVETDGVLSRESFGHNGFTGTSLWIDPVTERIHVLLTNRVHPDVRPLDMNALRRRFHEAARRVS